MHGDPILDEDFAATGINDYWFFSQQWAVQDGVLVRNDVPGANARLFVKKWSAEKGLPLAPVILSPTYNFRSAGVPLKI